MTVPRAGLTCPVCATPLGNAARFCSACGTDVGASPHALGGAANDALSMMPNVAAPNFAAPDFGAHFDPLTPGASSSPFGASGMPFDAMAGAPFAVAMQGGDCATCGGRGARLPQTRVFCSNCRWLRPLADDYALPIESFLWRLDADAMNVLSRSAH